MKYSTLCFLLILSCLTHYIFAQNSYYFERITTNDGLSQSDVNDVVQDDEGFMWFATHDGLNRFDGYSFKEFIPNRNKANSISSNLVYALKTDKNGNLWIGTTGGGLVFYNKTSGAFKVYRNNPNTINSISSDYVGALHIDNNHKLWIGTSNGLNILDDLQGLHDNPKFIHVKPNREPSGTGRNIQAVNALFEDKNAQLWVGGFAGIYKLSRDSNGDNYLKYINYDIGLPVFSVKCIMELKDRLLVATSNGLYYQDSATKSFQLKKVLDGVYNDLLLHNNVLWAGTQQGLLEIKLGENNELTLVNTHIYDTENPNSISKNIIVSLFKDRTGMIWAGTNGGGVNRFDPNGKHFNHVKKTQNPSSLSYDKIRAFFEDSDKRLWIGTEGGGLNLRDDSSGKANFITIKDLLNVYAIQELKRAGKTYILFGGQGNGHPSLFELDITDLPRYINGKNSLKNYKIKPITDFSTSVFSLLNDSKGHIWIGTYGGGVYRWTLNPDNKTYTKDNFTNDAKDTQSLSGNIIRYIYEDSYGNIWFATNNGLSQLHSKDTSKQNPTFKVFKNDPLNPNTISLNYILSVHEDAHKNIWVGTFGGGLNVLRLQDNGVYGFFKTYTKEDGLPNNVIKGILEDNEGFLWLSTNKGLSKFNKNAETFKNYDVNDGLQNNEFQELAYFKRKNGEFLFGGVNGYNTFFPDKLTDNTYKPETAITKFYVSNNEISAGDTIDGHVLLNKTINNTTEITLKHFQNNISFEFAALHFVAPLKNEFKYKLEGFDSDWKKSPSKKRYASYTNLSHGNYTFKVKSSNNDGLWNDEPASIQIKIKPPFWLSWYAYVVYCVLLLLVLWVVQSYFNLSSKQKASLQVQREIEQVNKLKLQFFTNISHEFKTPITLILNPIEDMLETLEEDSLIRSKLKIVQRNANSLLRLVNQLMEFRKIEVGETKLAATKSNLVSFVREILNSFRIAARKSELQIHFDSQLKTSEIWFDWDKLEKILNNLIYNAIKFTNPGGAIYVRVNKATETDKLKVKNCNFNLNYLMVEVEDNGIGISEEELPYIFHRFYQVNQTRERTRKGSGIGLAITKDLVELHHGYIAVESKKNTGTKFTILLPLGKAHLLPEDIIKNKIEDDDNSYGLQIPNNDLELNASGKNLDANRVDTILIVDDNPDIRLLIKEEFSKKFNVIEAQNGTEGLKIALKCIPDLIISDILMPEMDGIEFCAAIKSNVRTSHIPVILLTALNSVEHRIEGLESGADAYIPKPFKMKLLYIRAEKLIATRAIMRKRFQTESEITPEQIVLDSVDEAFLKRIMALMEANMGNENYWVDELAADMNTSRSTFFRKLKKLTGQAPNDFMRVVRLKRAVQLLEQDELNITQVSYMVGFTDPSYFGKCFKKVYGVSPSQYIMDKQ